jgi:ribose transport system substrate-binding protein
MERLTETAWEAGVSLEGLVLPRRIGVSINYGAHIWYQVMGATEQELGKELGIEVLVENADMDVARQGRQVEQLLHAGAEALIYSAVEPARSGPMLDHALNAGIPVIAESIWLDHPAVVGTVMINDYSGGRKVGRAAGRRLAERGVGQARVLDVTAPWLAEGLRRSDGFLAGLREFFPDLHTVRRDGRADIETSARVAAEVLSDDPSYNVVFGVDDESAIGARQAYQQLGIPPADLLICSFGFSGLQAYEWLKTGTYQIVCAMFPEYQARMLLYAAIYAYNHRSLPRHLVAPCVALTAEGLPDYYTRHSTGLQLNVEAVRRISTSGESLV